MMYMHRTIPRAMERVGLLPALTQYKKQISLFTLLLFFVLGMMYGVLLLRSQTDVYTYLQFWTGEYTQSLQERSLLQNFWAAFSSIFLFLFAAYLLGFSSIGQPCILLIPLFRGLGLGSFMGYLYVEKGIAGIGYSILILLPYSLLALVTIVIGCREALRLSASLFRSALLGTGTPIGISALKLYHIKFLILCLFLLTAAVLNTICVFLFARFFPF